MGPLPVPEASFEDFLDECCGRVPASANLFSAVPSKDSIPVRRLQFSIEALISQLKLRVPAATQQLVQSVIYKFNGPQRHQCFWRKFRHVSAALRKYNQLDLLKFLNGIHKKMSSSSSYFYMLTPETIQYITATYLTQLYRLRKLRQLCLDVTHRILGQIELGQWENFSIFLIGLCADINGCVAAQTEAIADAYKFLAEFARSANERFPMSVNELPLVSSLREKTSGSSDNERVQLLLKMTEEQMETVMIGEQMQRIRQEMMSSLCGTSPEVDLGVTISRKDMPTPIPQTPEQSTMSFPDEIEPPVLSNSGMKKKKKGSKKKVKTQSLDSAIVTDFDCTLADSDSVFNETTDYSQNGNEEGSAGRKRKSDVLCESESDVTSVVKKKKIKRKKNANIELMISDADVSTISTVSDCVTVKKKKKRIKRLSSLGYESMSGNVVREAEVLSDAALSISTTPGRKLLSDKKKKKRKPKTPGC